MDIVSTSSKLGGPDWNLVDQESEPVIILHHIVLIYIPNFVLNIL